MKRLLLTITLTISPILAQCDWNEDGAVDVLDIVQTVDCILGNGPCPDLPVYGCTDPLALNYNPEATVDDGSCEYAESECIDIDGNIYETVTIGDQIWMAENLKVTHYNNGDAIQTGYSLEDWENLLIGAYAMYDDDPNNAEIYGNLYNWYAVGDERSVCPEGWHIPSDEEYMSLERFLGMSYEDTRSEHWRGTNEGSKLASDSNLWDDGDLDSNEDFGASGFNVLPSGKISFSSYSGLGLSGKFWTSTEHCSTDDAWGRSLLYYSSEVYRFYYYKIFGHSVRCVRD